MLCPRPRVDSPAPPSTFCSRVVCPSMYAGFCRPLEYHHSLVFWARLHGTSACASQGRAVLDYPGFSNVFSFFFSRSVGRCLAGGGTREDAAAALEGLLLVNRECCRDVVEEAAAGTARCSMPCDSIQPRSMKRSRATTARTSAAAGTTTKIATTRSTIMAKNNKNNKNDGQSRF